MKIYLVRHGQTTGDVENKYGGKYDDELTKEGESQAQELAKKLSEKNINYIFSSPLKRAIQTSEIISKELKIEFDIIDNFRERNMYGGLSGLTKEEAKEKHAEEVEKLEKHPYNTFVTNSEYYKRFVNRLIPSFERIINEFEGNLLIVTHGGPIKTLFRELFKFGEIKEINDCCLVEIEIENNDYKIVKLDGVELDQGN